MSLWSIVYVADSGEKLVALLVTVKHYVIEIGCEAAKDVTDAYGGKGATSGLCNRSGWTR